MWCLVSKSKYEGARRKEGWVLGRVWFIPGCAVEIYWSGRRFSFLGS